MSPFICSKKHMQTIAYNYVNLFYDQLDQNDHNILAIATILYKENIKSVNWRYDENHVARKYKKLDNSIIKDCSLIQLYKLVLCLDYQSCETTTYINSHAKAILSQIEAKIVPMISSAFGQDAHVWYNEPLYNDAEWCI
jgi:hypothetical protein